MSSDGVRVLVGPGGSLSAIESVRSLRAAGHHVTVFTGGARRIPLEHEKGVTVVRIPDPLQDLAGATQAFTGLLGSGTDVVMPLDDIALALLRCAGPGSSRRPVVAGPGERGTAVALDKRLQLQAAEAAGFLVPATTVLESVADLPAEVRLPVVVKPALAVEVADDRLVRPSGVVCTTTADLRRAAGRASPTAPLLVQPLLAGAGTGVFGLGVAGEARALSGHRRVRMMNPSGSGASACRPRALPQAEVDATASLVRDLGWSSLFMVELLEPPDGRPWFMELNGRAWGSMALARRQGFEYPRWAVSQACGSADVEALPLVLSQVPEDRLTARHLGREVVHLGAVLRSGRREPGWPTRLQALRQVLRPSRWDRWYNLDRSSPRVFLADTWLTMSSQLFRGRRP